jgi:heme oxygenase (biliverdin-IX-beta and delta-forming)
MISTILKEETKRLHAETEKSLNAKRIFSADFRENEYVEILRILYRSHQVLENQLDSISAPSLAAFYRSHYSPLHLLIKKDLAHHDSSIESDTILQTIDTNDLNALGILYVLKGSSLGGKHIYKQLRDNRGGEFSLQFYKASSSQTLEEWKAFCESMEDLDLSPEETDQVIDGAKLAFTTFIQASAEIRGE